MLHVHVSISTMSMSISVSVSKAVDDYIYIYTYIFTMCDPKYLCVVVCFTCVCVCVNMCPRMRACQQAGRWVGRNVGRLARMVLLGQDDGRSCLPAPSAPSHQHSDLCVRQAVYNGPFHGLSLRVKLRGEDCEKHVLTTSQGPHGKHDNQ